MKILSLVQGSKEWLDFRMNKISATNASSIMSLNPYESKHMLWEEKMGLRAPKIPNAFMTRGSMLEPEARKIFEGVSGWVTEDLVVQSDEYEFAMASLDGYIGLMNELLEIKCPGKTNYAKYKELSKTDQISPDHFCQMQHQFLCTGCEQGYYFCYSGRPSDFFVVVVSRDDAFISDMVKKEEEFYNCLMNFEEPK